MREIKFRVWHKPTEQFVERDIFYLGEPGFVGQLSIGLDGTLIQAGMYDDYAPVAHPENYVIQQYIGLSDRNGKEIYEGDIIQHYAFPLGNTCPVKWDENQGAWLCHGSFQELTSSEVVGNILENDKRQKALDELSRQAQDLGMGY